MNSEIKEQLQTAVVAGLAVLGAYATRKILEKSWKKTTKKDPPVDPTDDSNSWLEILAWAAVTGIAANAARVMLTWGVTEGIEKLEDKA
ncbi:MAG TPA: DUF4235 domain-containing protein [Lunatimonas sp.]|nr:DUF4235 domain-containing protein [Lunatimonas sp.]